MCKNTAMVGNREQKNSPRGRLAPQRYYDYASGLTLKWRVKTTSLSSSMSPKALGRTRLTTLPSGAAMFLRHRQRRGWRFGSIERAPRQMRQNSPSNKHYMPFSTRRKCSDPTIILTVPSSSRFSRSASECMSIVI